MLGASLLVFLGGMSWQSSAEYYRIINEAVQQRLGGLHSARCLVLSVDFAEVEVLQRQERWEQVAEIMIDAGRRLEAGGADLLVICANTPHLLADQIQSQIRIPLLHIADAAAHRIKDAGMHTVGLLGTKFTMEQDFYRSRLESHGLSVLIPPEQDRDIVHHIIYEELCLGDVRESSRTELLRIIIQLNENGAEGVIEGCTEIVMLLKQEHTDIPLFDTTEIHARQAVAEALK